MDNPIQIRPDRDARIVEVRITGEVTLDELARASGTAMDGVEIDVDWPTLYNLVGMRLRLPEGGIGFVTMEQFVRSLEDRRSDPDARIAVLVDSDLLHGFARMFGSIAGQVRNGRMEVFQDRDKALRWLTTGNLDEAGWPRDVRPAG